VDIRSDISGYRYPSAELGHAHSYLLPTVFRLLESLDLPHGERRLFELGCGNDSVANTLARRGWEVTGVDPSTEGIAQARSAYPGLRLEQGSGYDNLVARFGRFPVVLNLEVVEHVYAPRDYARTLFELLVGGYRDRLDSLSRLLEEPCLGGHGQDGCALHGPLGPWAYQVLVDSDVG
jgi:SAM-dependent methyltransferase